VELLLQSQDNPTLGRPPLSLLPGGACGPRTAHHEVRANRSGTNPPQLQTLAIDRCGRVGVGKVRSWQPDLKVWHRQTDGRTIN